MTRARGGRNAAAEREEEEKRAAVLELVEGLRLNEGKKGKGGE